MIFLIALSSCKDAFAGFHFQRDFCARALAKKMLCGKALFGLFQFLMAASSAVLGSRVKDCIPTGPLDCISAFAVIGANMIRESLKEEKHSEESHLTSKVLNAAGHLRQSIDALAVVSLCPAGCKYPYCRTHHRIIAFRFRHRRILANAWQFPSAKAAFQAEPY